MVKLSGFDEVVSCAGFVGSTDRLGVVLRRDDHDWDVSSATEGAQSCARLEPV